MSVMEILLLVGILIYLIIGIGFISIVYVSYSFIAYMFIGDRKKNNIGC